MAKMKGHGDKIGEGVKDLTAKAGEKSAEFTTFVAAKYEEYKAQMGPAAMSAKESMDTGLEKISVGIQGAVPENVKQWSSEVMGEWQEPYEGKVFDALFCTLGVVDLTYPSCVGLRYKGLCCCIDGECTMCAMGDAEGGNKTLWEVRRAAANATHANTRASEPARTRAQPACTSARCDARP